MKAMGTKNTNQESPKSTPEESTPVNSK